MPSQFEKAMLRQTVPSLFGAVEKLEIENADRPKAGSLQVVVAEVGTDLKLSCSALSGEWLGKLGQWVESTGLSKISEPVLAVVDGLSWLLCPVSKVKTTAKQRARQAGLEAAKAWLQTKFETVTVAAHGDFPAADVIEGFLIGCYQLETFKGAGEAARPLPKRMEVLGAPVSKSALLQARTYAASVILTRTIQDAPGNWFNSERFAAFAEEVAKEIGAKVTVKGRKEMAELGMGSFLSVAAGTDIDPKLIIIEIAGEDASKTVGLIGKGLTFDAGGVSLKPAANMHEMKYDMSGGAAVLGSAYYLGKIKPRYNVVCAIGAVENVMSASATKPGDIVRAYNGKTIEVLNTDAEGRLVLADVLSYVEKNYKPACMVDIATLTGAVLIGLGSAGCGLMTNDEQFGDLVLKVAAQVGEPAWKLPMWPELEKETASDIADLKNIASPDVRAGTIMGAMFLKDFVGDSKWVHLDIAGTGWSCKATGFPQKGGSGFGVRLLTQICNQEL